ncbi:MAG: hypothetical protein JG777_723 [Clostridia bacterium]|jgi:hypothetical protein|nr:hypothetical protein [Petroclostridium xylanilyticum]MBZ4645234.1 hypothetical protein [Clostridia bacterium]
MKPGDTVTVHFNTSSGKGLMPVLLVVLNRFERWFGKVVNGEFIMLLS